MTSVLGHTVEWDFKDEYRKWNSCSPGQLFEAPTEIKITVGVYSRCRGWGFFYRPGQDKKDIAANIAQEARNARVLFIWTDCDREGEYIGKEIRDIALKAKPLLEVKRARFSNIEKVHIIRAAQNPVNLDERQADAVAARIELDLRIGAAFTRWQTFLLQGIQGLQDQLISYGGLERYRSSVERRVVLTNDG
jgi:DNA topoisomerase-3